MFRYIFLSRMDAQSWLGLTTWKFTDFLAIWPVTTLLKELIFTWFATKNFLSIQSFTLSIQYPRWLYLVIICFLEKIIFQVLSATPNVVNPILYGCLRPDLRKLASDLINGYFSTRTSTATANTISFRYTEPVVQKLISNRRASQIKHI